MENAITDCLLRVPEEVMYGYIFPYLELNDLLRLRRVCKQIKQYSSDFIRNHFNSQERETNENFTFQDIIKCDLPTSHIYLNNTGPELFQDVNIPDFLRLYSSKITHLRVKHFQTCISEPENNFFIAMTNLQHLTLEYTDARQRKLGYTSRSEMVNGVSVMTSREKCYFPENFKTLKTLKLGEIKGSEIFDQNYAWDFIQFCPNLEYLEHPYWRDQLEGTSTYHNRGGPFGCILDCIENRIKEFPNEPIRLKYYDLQHHTEPEGGQNGFTFLELVRHCYQQNVKLLNLDAPVLDMVSSIFRNDKQKYAIPLVSVRNIHFSMLMTELSNLEKLVITSTRKCDFADLWNDNGEVGPKWPKLESLKVNIDSGNTQDSREVEAVPVSELFQFLFGGVEREKLTDLRISFDKEKTGNRRGVELRCPRVQDIVNSCKNLTKLALSNWIGANKTLVKFWEGLTLLEEVKLDECRVLGDAAFLGKNKEEPSFLKLKNLKTFSLTGLDIMTKVTDLAFNLVFRNLKIKQFYLASAEPIESITVDGFQSLLTGDFNNSVEKFPFEGWSMKNVSEEEFVQLKMQFRASHMI